MKLTFATIIGAIMAMVATATTTKIDFDDRPLGALPADYYSGLTFSCIGNPDAPLCEVVGTNTELKNSLEYKVTFDCPALFEKMIIWMPGTGYAEADVVITQSDNTVTTTTVTRDANGDKMHPLTFNMADVVEVKVVAKVGEVYWCEFEYVEGVCPVGGGGGDPHFTRFHHDYHESFHGECDLVMVQSPQFHDETGFDLQVRTTIDSFYSYIEAAGVRIGDNILQISAKDNKIYLNGLEVTAPVAFASADNKHHYVYTETSFNGLKKKSALKADGRTLVEFRSYKNYLTLSVKGNDSVFADARGLLGDIHEGEMIDRDGKVFQGQFFEFAFEWQVNHMEGDPALFVDAERSPQLPFESCRLPTEARPARRLRAASRLLKDAQAACEQVVGNDNDLGLCIDDVMATGDVNLAQMW